jgi:hypothetical protein
MIDTNFLSDQAFLKIKAIRRVRKVLQREKQLYLRVLHNRCGVGITPEDFDTIVKSLVDGGWCHLKTGTLGAVTVIFNEQFGNVNVPDAPEASQVGQ